MELNNPSFQEQLATTSQINETESENAINQELNDAELDAIAGGYSSTIPTITVDPSQVPQWLISHRQNIVNRYSRLFG